MDAEFTSVVAKLEHSLEDRFETSESNIGSETSQCSNRTCSIESWDNPSSGKSGGAFIFIFDVACTCRTSKVLLTKLFTHIL